jgi:hypothetical protein
MISRHTPCKFVKKSYKPIILASAITLFQLPFASFFIPQVHAEGTALSTFPTTLQLRGQPPADVRSGFSISNQGTKTVKLNVILRPFKADAANDGKVLYLEGNDPKLLQKVQIIDNGYAVSTLELGPKQTKNLQVRVQILPGEPITDYYFSVIFLTVENLPKQDAGKDAKVLSTIQEGIALNVLVASGPKELPNASIAEYSTPSTFRDSGPVAFTVKIRNNGPHFVTPKGVILIKNIFGQTVGRLDLQNTNILAGTTRSMIGTPYNKAANSDAAPSDITSSTAVWPEKFLLGIYSANLSLALSEDGPVFNQTIRFIAFPSKLLLILGIIALVLLLISLRIRKKLKNS